MNSNTQQNSKYKIAWLPGDGIGVDVLEATRIVLDKIKVERRLHPRRHRLGVLAQGGRCSTNPDYRAAQECGRGYVWSDHVQAGQGGGRGAGA